MAAKNTSRNAATKKKRSSRSADCFFYKVFGECREGPKCPNSHDNLAHIVYYNYVSIPKKISVNMVLGHKGANLWHWKEIEKCHVTVFPGKRAVRIVSCRDLESQRKLVEELKIKMSQEHPTGPLRVYITGIDAERSYTFQEHTKGRKPPQAVMGKMQRYQLVPTDEAEGSQEPGLCVEDLAAKSPETPEDTQEGLFQALEYLHGEDIDNTKWTKTTRIVVEPETKIKEALGWALDWHCRRERIGHNTRLDARFGKVLWSSLTEDIIAGSVNRFGMETIAHVLFSDTPPTTIFNSDVERESAEELCKMLRNDMSPNEAESYDFKLTLFKEGVRLSVKLQFSQEKKEIEVLQVKKNEIKLLIFDILSLDRHHDFRISLHDYEVLTQDSPLYGIVETFRQSFTFDTSKPAVINFPVRTGDWNVHFIRHKKERTYVFDNKYAVTISDIKEYKFSKNWRQNIEKIPLAMPDNPDNPSTNDAQCHCEVEFHNLAWECAFGRDAGLSPEQSLARHMEQGTVDPAVVGAIPHPWQPEHILQDFQEFWDNLDSLRSEWLK